MMSDGLRSTPLVAVAGDWPVDIDEDIALAGRSNARVLVTGPDTSRNEDVARLIHQCSARFEAPFVHVDCAGMTDQALEAKLFGFNHDRAAAPVSVWSGAVRGTPDGTILLSSVHALSARIQGLLSNWLLAAELRRHTEMRVQPANVRLISESTRNLHEDLETGVFRADLYYLLNQIYLHCPG